ncbi:MAG: hypothetical protein JW803_08160 [Endomicrobiales bacterium]|nr:hypothetical protein [Endomicrobiales bacterium]
MTKYKICYLDHHGANEIYIKLHKRFVDAGIVQENPAFFSMSMYYKSKFRKAFKNAEIVDVPNILDWMRLKFTNKNGKIEPYVFGNEYFERGWKLDKVLRFKKREDVLLLWNEIVKRSLEFLERTRPDFIIGEQMQVMPYYAVFLCAVKLKIPYIHYATARLEEGTEIYNSVSNIPLDFNMDTDAPKEIVERAKGHIERIRSKFYKSPLYGETEPPKVKNEDIRKYFKYLYEQFNGGMLETTGRGLFSPVRSKLTGMKLYKVLQKGKYFKHIDAVKELKGKKKLFFPLHVTPEASTDLWAPKYNDMYETARMITDKLPGNWVLVIKEHPSVVTLQRPIEEIEKISRLPNSVFLGPYESNAELFKLCDAGIMILGTLGMEMIINGFPTITIADAVYNATGNTVYCPDLENLPKALNDVLKKKIDEDKNIRFVAGFINCIAKGVPINPDFYPEYLNDDNISVIADSFKARVLDKKQYLLSYIDQGIPTI